MNAVPSGEDTLVALIAAARTQARGVIAVLNEVVVPIFPPECRTFPEHLSRKLVGGNVFNDTFVRDLDALIALVEISVADGTHALWVVDENHVSGGYDTIFRSTDILGLDAATMRMRGLRLAIAIVIDTARAVRDAEQLLHA